MLNIEHIHINSDLMKMVQDRFLMAELLIRKKSLEALDFYFSTITLIIFNF